MSESIGPVNNLKLYLWDGRPVPHAPEEIEGELKHTKNRRPGLHSAVDGPPTRQPRDRFRTGTHSLTHHLTEGRYLYDL